MWLADNSGVTSDTDSHHWRLRDRLRFKGAGTKADTMLRLSWIKCDGGNNWCDFELVDLTDVTAKGVYIIWHQGDPSRVVRIGQGDIAFRLGEHRSDRQMLAYMSKGKLRVTWAAVSAAQRDGVEAYLSDVLPPLVGDVFPDAEPIVVNSPWG